MSNFIIIFINYKPLVCGLWTAIIVLCALLVKTNVDEIINNFYNIEYIFYFHYCPYSF